MAEYVEYRYYLEDEGDIPAVAIRRTRPRIGAIIHSHGMKWEVFYVEDGPNGISARCEPKPLRVHR